jgi:hypothetical protein
MKTRSNHPPLPAVELRRSGQAVIVEPWPAGAERNLQMSVRKGVLVPRHGFSIATVQVPLCNLRKEGGRQRLSCWAGLEPVIERILAQGNRKVTRRGPRLSPLPPPDERRAGALGAVDRPLLDLVQQHERGVILYEARKVDVILLVAQMIWGWANLTYALVTKRIEDVRALRDRLRNLGIDAVAATSRNIPAKGGQVAVCTPVSLAEEAINVAWLDVVVAMDAVQATGKKSMECLCHAGRARLYGLLPDDCCPSPLETDQLAKLFGFAEGVVSRHGYRERIVQVVTMPNCGGAPLPLTADLVDLYRSGLWHHERRNRSIARLARSFREASSGLNTGLRRGAEVVGDEPTSGVLVLVENVEHALTLAHKLPDWQLIVGPDVYEEGLSAQQIRRLHRPETSETPFVAGPLYAIVTAAALSIVDLARVGTLIRANGGVGLPPLARSDLAVYGSAAVSRLLLVDFADRHHPLLRRQSRLRHQAYVEQGWFGAGVDPMEARIDRFVANRPKEVSL